MMKNRSARMFQNQGGFTLLEALIAAVVLAGGLLAAYRFHSITMASTGEAKVRSEAVALAEKKLEELRSFLTVVEFDADLPSLSDADFLAGVKTGTDTTGDLGAGYAADFTRDWTVRGTNPREVAVMVTWTDRTNTGQNITLSSLIWRMEPDLGPGQFTSALTGGSMEGDSIWGQDGFPPAGGIVVESKDFEGNEIEPGATDPETGDPIVVVTYDILFTGSFAENNPASLAAVSLTQVSGDSLTRNCTVGDTGKFKCTISGIPNGTTWTGTIGFTVAGGGGNPGVCEVAASGGLAELSFSQTSSSLAESSTPDISAISVVSNTTNDC